MKNLNIFINGSKLEKEYHTICEHRIKAHEKPEQTQLPAK